MTVGENIRRLRKEKGLSQKKLGELCGINEVQIRRYELGGKNSNPKFETLKKIAEALDCDVFDLTIGPDANRKVNIRVTAIEGVIAILKEVYGNVEEKSVFDKNLGECFYYRVGTKDNYFVLYEGDIEKLLEYFKSSVPFMVDNMKDSRTEKEIVEEILQELREWTPPTED